MTVGIAFPEDDERRKVVRITYHETAQPKIDPDAAVIHLRDYARFIGTGLTPISSSPEVILNKRWNRN